GTQNFSTADLSSLLGAIEDVYPVGNEGWERVTMLYADYAEENKRTERSSTSLRTQYRKMVNHTKPTGDPDCPTHIRRAKRVAREIEQAYDVDVLDD
ncbi:hypothetical protein EDC01DRAFT_597742, partial [Geopyxis carbonaria]